MNVWVLIVVLMATTILLKTLGPAVAGGRNPPAPVVRVIGLLGPALIAALIVVGTVTTEGRLVLDARIAGLLVGGLALWLRAPVVVALLLAATTCALIRLLA